MIYKIKKIMRKHPRIINNIPFFNRIRLHGAKLTCEKLLIGTKIASDGRDNVLIFHGGGVLHNCCFYISGNKNLIEIGAGTNLKDVEIWITDDNNSVSIGRDTIISGKTFLGCFEGSQIVIGDNCLFSTEIVFRTGDSHSLLDSDGNRINPAKDIVIGEHVWICYRVIVNKGTRIERDSIIGTGSLVSGFFDKPNIVLAGVPARIIRDNCTWDIKLITDLNGVEIETST